MSQLSSEIIKAQSERFDSLKLKRAKWDKVEELFHGILNDAISLGSKSQVFDPRMASLIIERAYRVMSQLGTGKVVGVSENDMGDAKLKNLLLDKYVVPNANSQFDLLTKFRMVDMYSGIYGSFDALVDWNVKKGGYTGPDMWLLNKRDVFLPVGAISIADSSDVIVRTWRDINFFKGLASNKSFKNIPEIIEKLEKKAGDKSNRDSENMSKREEHDYDRNPDGYYEVLTRYENDKWTDVCKDADIEFREIKNPHENDELPICRKYSMPLIDDADGLGDAERAASMQMVQNSIWNLMLDGAKMSMYPPILLNKDNIASMSSIQWGAAKKWLVRGNIQNAVQPIPLSPKGMDVFNNVFQASNASLLNVFGTTDTSVSQQQDQNYGKTPQALKMQQARENTRDNADKFFMEMFVQDVMRKMVNLLGKKQSSDITIRMFPEEIEQLARDYPDIKGTYDEEKGTMSIPKTKKSVTYDYQIVSGSTYALDKESQQENISKLIGLYQASQSPQGNMLVNDLAKEGVDFHFSELIKMLVASSGLQDWDKIITEKTEEEKVQGTLENDKAAFEAELQKFQTGQNINQVPPTPGGSGQPPMPQGGQSGAMPSMPGQNTPPAMGNPGAMVQQ